MNPNAARLRPLTVFMGMTALSASVAWFANPAHAGGFALIEHGASGLGNSYAGAAAVSNDGSTVWFNPAGMSELDGREMSAALHMLSSTTTWTDEGTELGSALRGGEVSGPDTASPGTTSPLPNFYYVAPINDKWSYGLSIGVPFGSSTEYDEDWKGRYTTVKSGINVIDINPAFSFKVNQKVRLGFGVSLQQLSAELGSNVDSGAVCAAFGGRPDTTFSTSDCLNAGLLPNTQPNDSTAEITGDSLGFGFNLGALFLPSEGVKIGVAYRHGVDHELDGTADFGVNPTLREFLDRPPSDDVDRLQGLPVPQQFLLNGPAIAEVELPATLSLSLAWQATDKFEFLSDLTWTGWSSFEELRVVYDNPSQPDTLSVQEWDDVFRFSAGVNYRHNAKLLLRTGFAFDEEAIPSAERRTARIPGNDRTWISFGLTYKVNQRFSYDIGYAHLFLDDTPINNSDPESGGRNTWVRGVYEPSVDILSAQINWDFN